MATEYLNNKSFEILIVKFQHAKREKIKFQLLMDDILTTQERTKKRGKYKKPNGWLATEKLYEAANFEFQETQKEIATSFYLLCENIVRYARFYMIDPEDAIQEGVLICFEKIDRFNAKKGKGFNFFSTVTFNCLKQMYRSSKSYVDLKRKYLDFISIKLDNGPKTQKKNNYYNSLCAEK